MIHDLVGAGQVFREADVLVVGAGTVGLVLATSLQARGLRVLCVESGGERQQEETHPFNAVEHVRAPYAGAAHGRFRCLGGTSTRWGGALIPFAAADFESDLWPFGILALAQHVGKVEALFGLPATEYEFPDVLGPSVPHLARLAKWPSFRKRNVFHLLHDAAESLQGPEVWINATASRFALVNGSLRETTALSLDGSSLTVRAKEVVLASGAIESTRLLLLLDKQNKGAISRHTRWLGAGFFDHLSAAVADLSVLKRPELNRLVGFRFEEGGTMRNMRFELTDTTGLRAVMPACFAHVAFEAGTSGGFMELRELFRLLQRGRRPDLGQLKRLALELPWLAKAAYWRFVEKRLLYPAGAAIQLHMVIDQEAVEDNRITLSHSLIDPFGQPLARISWAVTDRDRTNMSAATDAMLATWARSRLAVTARANRRTDVDIYRAMEDGGGIYHPGGSTRMAQHSSDGVVDSQLRVFQIPNLRVVSTSVMPSGGGANPTMTLLLLGLRCVDDLVAGCGL